MKPKEKRIVNQVSLTGSTGENSGNLSICFIDDEDSSVKAIIKQGSAREEVARVLRGIAAVLDGKLMKAEASGDTSFLGVSYSVDIMDFSGPIGKRLRDNGK